MEGSSIQQLVHNFGHLSLELFWFPLGVWTIIASITLIILRSFKALDPLYKYHLRVAIIFAIPFKFRFSYLNVYYHFLFASQPGLLASVHCAPQNDNKKARFVRQRCRTITLRAPRASGVRVSSLHE